MSPRNRRLLDEFSGAPVAERSSAPSALFSAWGQPLKPPTAASAAGRVGKVV